MARATVVSVCVLACLALLASTTTARLSSADIEVLRKPGGGKETKKGTRWALLIAGSSGWGNYRHQADVCHAYQLLHKDGLKDEHIVVMMYDDIAHNQENPRPGVIINHPEGPDVYKGVPKDYTGRQVNVHNFLAVLLGDEKAMNGIGSGKVIKSGPNDHVFVYYTDHGGPGILGMPEPPFLLATDIHKTLKKKHAEKGYKQMVIYIEACESGSILEGILEDNLDIYATTASNAMESSWGCYCPTMDPPPPALYTTCLGDLYSVSWMENSDARNLEKETLLDQYKIVKDRVSNHGTYAEGSHVMQFGDLEMDTEECALYLGTDPANEKNTGKRGAGLTGVEALVEWEEGSLGRGGVLVQQRDAERLHLWLKMRAAPEGSPERAAAAAEYERVGEERLAIDNSIERIGDHLLGPENHLLLAVRPKGLPLVDDWECLREMIQTFEEHCRSLTQYGMKHTRVFANLCNRGVQPSAMGAAARAVCPDSTPTLQLVSQDAGSGELRAHT